MNLLIKNAKLITKGKQVAKDILIEKGIISQISKNIQSQFKTIDAKNNFVIPGMIDCHVHARDLKQKHKEDFLTVSKAAAAGGITTILTMPNTSPPIFDKKTFDKYRKLAKKSLINVGFHFGSSAADNLKEIKNAKNVASTKVYLNQTTGNLLIDNDKLLENIFHASKMISAHAEEEKVPLSIKLAKKTKKRLYLCHISRKTEIDYIRKNKTKNIFCEVCPQHLFLTKSDIKILGNYGRMKPELQTKEDQKALWEQIDTTVDTIGTDHAPHTKEEKRKVIFGVTGLETVLPLMLDAVNKKRLTLTRLVQLTSHNPARIFNIKNKGKIAVGYDADLTIIDINRVKKVDNNKLYTKASWSPWHGKKLKGWPTTTIVKGEIIYMENKVQLNKNTTKEVEYNEF